MRTPSDLTIEDWDKINRNYLIKKASRLLEYFQSEQRMEDFYTEQHKEKLQSYEEFKNQVGGSLGKVPSMITWLFRPLYQFSVLWHNSISWMYRRTEILSGRYEDLNAGRKIMVSGVMSTIVVFYIMYLVGVRAFNSIFLSMNTFTTLGFGEIPVKGIGRYLSILEGFLGWFLLSIFSVSLISQILQN